jgi:hypothetical protein
MPGVGRPQEDRMPTLAQIQAAIPKCPRIAVYGRGADRREERCGRPCRYRVDCNVWQCPNPGHGDVYAGEVLGAIANDPWLDLDGLASFVSDEARERAGI